jgi:hypothetical protein
MVIRVPFALLAYAASRLAGTLKHARVLLQQRGVDAHLRQRVGLGDGELQGVLLRYQHVGHRQGLHHLSQSLLHFPGQHRFAAQRPVATALSVHPAASGKGYSFLFVGHGFDYSLLK